MNSDTSASVGTTQPVKENSQKPGGEDPRGVGASGAVNANAAPGGSIASPAEPARVEVSASTITRMMGIASSSDLRLLEGRIDLLTAKVSGLVTKVERVVSMFGSAPSASDIDRLEIQIGTLKSLIKEVLEVTSSEADKRALADERAAAQEQSRKLREGIKSSEESEK